MPSCRCGGVLLLVGLGLVTLGLLFHLADKPVDVWPTYLATITGVLVAIAALPAYQSSDDR